MPTGRGPVTEVGESGSAEGLPPNDGLGEPGSREPDSYRPPTAAQWTSVVVTLIVLALLTIGLPRMSDAIGPQDVELAAGERIEAGGVAVEAAEGWALSEEGGDDLLIISKGESKLLVFPPTEGKKSAEDSVAAAEKVYTEDKSLHATIGEIATFQTESGLDAAFVTIAEQDAVTGLYSFADGKLTTDAQLSTSPAAYTDLHEEIQTMLSSLEFTDGSSS